MAAEASVVGFLPSSRELCILGFPVSVDVVAGARERRVSREGLVTASKKQARVSEYSLGVLHVQSRLRMWCLWLVHWPWFDRFILAAIFAVSVLMAMQDFRSNSNSRINGFITSADPYFLGIFTFECVLKIAAFGFVRHYASYLRNGFNLLDFVVVVGGLVEIIAGAGLNLRFLRVVRVLRPLRSVSFIKDMKVLVNAMIGSIPKLADVSQAALFFIMLFAIFGLQLFGGVFYRRCRLAEAPVQTGVCWSWPLDTSQIDRVCGGRYECLSGTFCGSVYSDDVAFGFVDDGLDSTTRLWCEDSVVDLSQSEKSNFGITTFDNFGAAFLTVFQALSLEGWTDIMYLLQDAFNDYAATLYFLVIVLLGSFFIWNLALAVVWDSFQEVHAKLTKGRTQTPSSPLSGPPPAEGAQTLWLWLSRLFSVSARPGRVRQQLKRLIKHKFFSGFVTACIVVNIVILCLDRYPPPPRESRVVQDALNAAFTYVFIAEMALTVAAIGVVKYLSNLSHLFDGILVTLSVVELASSSSGSAALVFRGLRLFRIFKLAKSWRSFRVLLNAMVRTAKSMYIFALLLGLALFTFALMGMNFFGGKLSEDGEVPRSNFDYFLRAMVTVFQLMTGENWNSVWYSCYVSSGWAATLYFFVATLVLRFLVMNLFMAILMDRFQENRDSIASKKTLSAPPKSNLTFVFGGVAFNAATGTLEASESPQPPQPPQPAQPAQRSSSESQESEIPRDSGGPSSSEQATQRVLEEQAYGRSGEAAELKWPQDYSLCLFPRGRGLRRFVSRVFMSGVTSSVFLVLIVCSSVTLAVDNPMADPNSQLQKILTILNMVFSALFLAEMVAKWVALGFFAYWRRGWNVLDGLVSLLSLSDVIPGGGTVGALKTFRVFRALRPLRLIARNENLQVIISTLFKLIPELGNLLFIGLLVFLMFGLFLMNFLKGAFFACVGPAAVAFTVDLSQTVTRSCIHPITGVVTPFGWGCVHPTVEFSRAAADFPICVADAPSQLSVGTYPSLCREDEGAQKGSEFEDAVSYLVLPCSSVDVQGVGQVPGCRDVLCSGAVDSDRTSGCAVECSENADALFICHESCASDGPLCAECRRQCEAACECDERCKPLTLDAAQCVEQGGAWTDFDMPVNNVGQAMLTLFQTASTEGWVEVMNRAIDSTGVMRQPKRDHNELGWIIFFMLFMLVCGLFILNLCIGLVVEKFNKIKAQSTKSGAGSSLLTETQRRWMYVQRVLGNQRRFSILNKVRILPAWRRRLFFFTASSAFELVISSCILLNAVAMAMDSFPDASFAGALTVMNVVFSFVFLAEMLAKLTALGISYFSDTWNRFDCFCVVASLVGIGLDFFGSSSIGGTIGVVRLLRLARLLRLVRRLKGLNRVFAAFFAALPKLLNVGVLVALMLFMFAVLGVQLFAGNIRYGQVDDHANFGSFYRSVVSLFRFMTGETWTYFMAHLGASPFFLARIIKTPCLSDFEAQEDNFATLERKCLLDSPVKCGNNVAIVLFFVSFVVIFSFAILNLFVAVVLEGFDDAKNSNDDEVIDSCVECWRFFDRDVSMELGLEDAVLFLEAVVSQVLREDLHKRTAVIEKRKSRAAELGVAIFALLPLDFARRSKLKVDGNRKVQFMDALESALRLLVAVPNESQEAQNPNFFTLFDHVAAAKIQMRLRIKKFNAVREQAAPSSR